MSCISKLGAPSMSRSSTATGAGTPGTGQPPNWSLLSSEISYHQPHQMNCPANAMKLPGTGLDRMSVCSSHGSYGSSSSEYSVPRMTCSVTHTVQSHESWYEHIPCSHQQSQQLQPSQNHRASSPNSHCKSCPPIRPPKPKSSAAKPPMPLPITDVLHAATITNQPMHQQHKQFAGPYENYDVPKVPVHVTHSLNNPATENYDTPKKIQEYLTKDMNSNPAVNIDIYGNYDMPAAVKSANMCNCISGGHNQCAAKPVEGFSVTNNSGADSENARIDCTCNKVMSWADTWITLPYCRRGNGIENTGIPINKVKLSGEGKMPVVQPSGQLAIYATVDMTKKIKHRIFEDMKRCNCQDDDDDDDDKKSLGERIATPSGSESSNYINLDPGKELTCVNKGALAENYMNLEFAMSLENYENAKGVLEKAGFSVGDIEETLKQCMPHAKICQKCGHVAKRINKVCENMSTTLKVESIEVSSNSHTQKPEDYMLMEPGKNNKNFPGYLPMSPAAPNNVINQPEEQTGQPTEQRTEQLKQQQQLVEEEKVEQKEETPVETKNEPLAQEEAQPTDSATQQTQPPPLPTKTELMKRLLGEKSASNPSLGPAVDRSRKRADHEARIPGSAMMLLHQSGGSPYMRKLLMDNSDLLPSDKRIIGRKRSSSADSSRFLGDIAASCLASTETLRKSVGALDSSVLKCNVQGRRASSPCLHQESENCQDVSFCGSTKRESVEQQSATETDEEVSSSMNNSQISHQSAYIRRSASVPCKAQNRDSSSSNDSGVSTGSTRHRNTEFTDFELPLTTAMSARRHQRTVQPVPMTSVHASLPRRSKSFDPLREISFQFQRGNRFAEKSTSAEAEIPICLPKIVAGNAKNGGYGNSHDAPLLNSNGQPYIDSRSTSSGTSDMSDYIETLSLSSHSSSDTPEGLR